MGKRLDDVILTRPSQKGLVFGRSAVARSISPSPIHRHTPLPTIILDASMRIIEVSNSHFAFSGKTRDELLGVTIGDVQPQAIPVPSISVLYGAAHAACTTRAPQIIGHTLVRGNLTYSLRVTPIFEGPTLLYILLEAQKVSEDTTHYGHTYTDETYKVLIDAVKDYAIIMLDAHGRVLTWNSGAALIKGYKAEDIIGKHFSVFYGPEDRANGKPDKALNVSLQEGRIEDEGWRYRCDGSRFWSNVLITPVYQFGHHVGFVKVTRDLTERKEAESRMITAFEEASRLKTDFLGNISHELRTPMNGIQIAMDMLVDTHLSAQQLEYTAIISDTLKSLSNIVNDLLDYAKFSSGSFSLHADIVDIRGIVSTVTCNCQSLLKDGVELTTDIPSDFPQRLRGDPLRYQQILQNLVSNAVKFTDKGSIKVSISCSPDEEDPMSFTVKSEVTDTGIGVSDNAINTLFTPFTRSANSDTRKYQGTGLGLSICKSLAELMGGTVGYTPNVDHGSVFWFTAKMGGQSSASPVTPRSLPAVPEPPDVATEMLNIAPQKHVLLVEDNLVNHTVMLKLLHGIGFDRVDGAWNGAEAVRLVQQKPLSYNAILMDISMPVMDGLAATGKIRDMGLDVPIIAITGNALKGDTETYMAKGMNDCIGKPVQRETLLHVLWKWVGSA
ncbi:hypothetical protein BDV11DRAFT_206378 [Aspergillus similis]